MAILRSLKSIGWLQVSIVACGCFPDAKAAAQIYKVPRARNDRVGFGVFFRGLAKNGDLPKIAENNSNVLMAKSTTFWAHNLSSTKN